MIIIIIIIIIIVNTLHKGDNKDDDDDDDDDDDNNNNNNNNLMVACSKQYMFSKALLSELQISPSSYSRCLVCFEVRTSIAFCFCRSLSRQRCISTDLCNHLSSGTYMYHLMQRR